ncbi:unnamed protein product [Amoebophrya sp. A25]|nr:unnamed protein product [Amoebophrya sp. A25]|eukprot:GSA25T00015679001.1
MNIPLATSDPHVPVYCGSDLLRRFISWWAILVFHPLYWVIYAIAFTQYLLFFSPTWYARAGTLIYLGYIFFDRRRADGKGFPDWISRHTILRNKRSFVWRICCSYYPFKLCKTAEIDGGARLLFVTHPHGIFGVATQGHLGTFGSGFDRLYGEQLGGRLRLIALEALLLIPFFREVMFACGVHSASRQSFAAIFAQGNIPVLNVGGAAESLIYQKSDEVVEKDDYSKSKNKVAGDEAEAYSPVEVMKLVVKNRKGFIKVAMQEGAALVPCIAFDENKAYAVYAPASGGMIERIQRTFKKKMKFTFPLFYGNIGPFHPLRQKQSLYVGAVLPVTPPVVGQERPSASGGDEARPSSAGPQRWTKIANPTQAEIDAKHAEYLAALQKLFDDYKDHAGHPNMVLQITDEYGKG